MLGKHSRPAEKIQTGILATFCAEVVLDGAAAVEEAVDVVRKSQVEITVPVPVVIAFARTAKNET